ncbi:MAG: glutamine amidotransferase [Candidatus Beckwithbacteria bacterium]
MELILAHLYPKLMNIYGDQGNVIALKYRCQQRQIKLIVKPIEINTSLPSGSFDLLFAGGGQDQQQALISQDLISRKKVLTQALNHQIPMLTICGSYQLFGAYFKPFNGPKLLGLNLFDAYTQASRNRKIGNIIVDSNFGKLVGFENHSGNTFLSGSTKPLGRVIKGFGNNGQDKTEGAIKQNLFGCYLHGSLLPKNPVFCDFLIKTALENKYQSVKLEALSNELEIQARQQAYPLVKYL